MMKTGAWVFSIALAIKLISACNPTTTAELQSKSMAAAGTHGSIVSLRDTYIFGYTQYGCFVPKGTTLVADVAKLQASVSTTDEKFNEATLADGSTSGDLAGIKSLLTGDSTCRLIAANSFVFYLDDWTVTAKSDVKNVPASVPTATPTTSTVSGGGTQTGDSTLLSHQMKFHIDASKTTSALLPSASDDTSSGNCILSGHQDVVVNVVGEPGEYVQVEFAADALSTIQQPAQNNDVDTALCAGLKGYLAARDLDCVAISTDFAPGTLASYLADASKCSALSSGGAGQ